MELQLQRLPHRSPRRGRQSPVAIVGGLYADGHRWFLFNASPDIRIQIESFPTLLPTGTALRGTALDSILLTNADLDHTLGLFVLREGRPLCLHATQPVRRALEEGLNLGTVLQHYCGVQWREPPLDRQPLLLTDGSSSGLKYAAFPIPGKPPRYFEHRATPAVGDCVGYEIIDIRTGARLVFVPDLPTLDHEVCCWMEGCDVLLIDGTFWSNHEMADRGVGTLTADRMGHLPLGGDTGTLRQIAKLKIGRKVYVHINNTNPILLENSPERHAVEAAGVEIGFDGMEFTL